MDRPPYEAAIRFYWFAEDNWPTLDFAFKEVDLLTVSPARFCNLIHGWVIHLIRESAKTSEEARGDIEQWEFTMSEPLPWQSERKPKTVTLQAERDSFLALDQIETH